MFTPRYNIAPTQNAAIVIAADDGPRLQVARWGLIPSWAKDAATGSSLINARAETVATKPAFRSAFKRRRCLVLADGFFEWQKIGAGKQAMYLRKRDGVPFMFGGIWERWTPPDGPEVQSFSIVTVAPNELAARVHDRMPLILDESDFSAWLDPKTGPETLTALLRPCPAEGMEAYPVSSYVNSPRNIGPDCVAPLTSN